MFEEYNEYLAVQYSSPGRKTAAFNTKLNRSLRLPEEQDSIAYAGKPMVLVCPAVASKGQQDSLWKKAWDTGCSLKYIISEPEAIVYFYRFQNHELPKEGVVKVIDIHSHSTDITLVRIEKNGIIRIRHKNVLAGGDTLTSKMTEYYMKKLKRVKGDITGDVCSVKKLREMSEMAKIRMSRHRLEKDEFIFHSPKDGIHYLLRIFREDYDRMVKDTLEEILSHAKVVQMQWERLNGEALGAVLMAGGMSEYYGCMEIVKARYESVPTVAYKGSEAAVLGAALYGIAGCCYGGCFEN